jgi:hypothetical protein
MKILLTAQESEQIFRNSLCNGHQIAYYGLQIDYDEKEYDKAKKRLVKRGESPCLEDVWMEILRGGGTLTLVDEENGMDASTINLQDVHDKVQLSDFRHLLDAINEEDDSDTADVILQSVFYGEVIFG